MRREERSAARNHEATPSRWWKILAPTCTAKTASKMALQRVIALPVHPAAVIASIAMPNKYGHTAKEASEIIAPIAAVKDVSTCLRSSQFRYATGDFSGGLPGGRSRSARTAGKPILGSGDTAIDPKLWV